MQNSISLKVLPLDKKTQNLNGKDVGEKSFLKPNYSRDENLTDFGKATLLDRYLLPGEKFQDMFLRVSKCYSDDENHAKNLSATVFDFSGKTNLHIIGSPFQIKVWRALLQIKAGQVVTYSDVATEIDQPSSVRAVGTAIGRNPISFLIPCHRVVKKSGGLGGYHWGFSIKKNLLTFENKKSKIYENKCHPLPLKSVL